MWFSISTLQHSEPSASETFVSEESYNYHHVSPRSAANATCDSWIRASPPFEPDRKNCIFFYFFCGALKKKVRGSSTTQGTSPLLTEEAKIRLKKAVAIREDERILIAVGSGEI